MIASHPLDDDANKINPEHQATFTAPPPLPMLPLPGKDLHLTLLILPALEHYTDSISHGIKSRDWGSDHDGMSFRVETMVWVDEKSARGEERGGLGRRKRLKMVTGAVGPAVRLGLGAGRGNVGVVAVAAAG